MNKEFDFKFNTTNSGWIDFDITIQNTTFTYSFSDVISTEPEELIAWLEKIYNQDYCIFECDTEGFIFCLDYDGENLRLLEKGNQRIGEFHNPLKAYVKIDRIKLCKIIYKAFRDFVNSKNYKKVEWQYETTFKETLIDGYGSFENAVSVAITKTLQEFYDDYIEKTEFTKYLTGFKLFKELEYAGYTTHPIEESYNCSNQTQKRLLLEKFSNDIVNNGDGGKLREVISETLENLIKDNTES